ncbi:unannotated protein [freshwater metagenome]|uniref:Unannotated protein n=1 Tax=freshwater metagenome TaxID=449393 RepID=A0A6J6TXU3_9ZZZZ|nr:hypothetical protein [Actinomycetota bacterium]
MSTNSLPHPIPGIVGGPLTVSDMKWASTRAFKADLLFQGERLEILCLHGAVVEQSANASEWLSMQQSLRNVLRSASGFTQGPAVWFDTWLEALTMCRAYIAEGRASAVVSDSWGTFDGYAVLVSMPWDEYIFAT